MNAVEQLVDQTVNAFAFLAPSGFKISSRKIIVPESFKGGFTLSYRSGGSSLEIQYSDMEFVVTHDGREMFGATNHPGFAGNMFSREHLAEFLPGLAESIRKELSHASTARA
jgi:hypothetical protein